jgi:hypothetical protein
VVGDVEAHNFMPIRREAASEGRSDQTVIASNKNPVQETPLLVSTSEAGTPLYLHEGFY